MAEQLDTVVIGGGQAGLAMSYFLSRQKREHIVLEEHAIGHAWRTRWDSFTLVSPNWTLNLPGHEYHGDNPDGFLLRDEVVRYVEQYAEQYNVPIRLGVRVTSVEGALGDSGYLVKTDNGDYTCRNVVVAAGLFQQPKLSPYADKLAPGVLQLHTSKYRNPSVLPDGGVLVVGSGQSGCQIAQELHESGRQVHLCVGNAKRIRRRYRGYDGFWWRNEIGNFDHTVADLDSPKERFAGNPHASGKNGGTEINLHEFARDGINLLGHLRGIQASKITLAPDLKKTLASIDAQEEKFCQSVDKLIRTKDIKAEAPDRSPDPKDGFDVEIVTELDLHEKGITTLIWAAGYSFDFSWVRFPVFDEYGFPNQQQGVTGQPGLYFLGLHFLHKRKSGLFLGVGEDAEHVAGHIAARS
ncbi:MAG: NAD(P)-binding domain-containing protein [SAR324 cluster bacterium]|nr:NAD(P)-binding domain-containing protein [SAR324 cluster bacterium]